MKLLRSGVVSSKDLGGGVGWRSVTNCIRGCGIANAADLNPELCNFHMSTAISFLCAFSATSEVQERPLMTLEHVVHF